MDLTNIFSVTTLLILISISGVRSQTVTLSKSTDKGQLGNNSLSLVCDYNLTETSRVLTIDLKRKRANDSSFDPVVSYYEDQSNASYYVNGSDLMGRTVLTNPTKTNRKATLQFSSIQCTDEADYQCELLYTRGQGNEKINGVTKIVVTATSMFGNQSLLYTPSTNLAENQNVTFTCIGNVGREPQGTFSWYKYVGGQASGIAITNGIKPVSLTNVAGSCTYVRTENLTLTLTKEDNQMVIRCTVWQTSMTEAGDGNIQTDRINVYYVPRINVIGSDPDSLVYYEGLAQLLLICNADSNPPSNYVWTLPDGTMQTGYRLRLTSLTTNHTKRYTCMAYTGWGGKSYTANRSIDITVVLTTTPPPTTTTTSTTRSYTTVPVTKKPGEFAGSGNTGAQTVSTTTPPPTTTTTSTTRSSTSVSSKKPGTAADSGNTVAQENSTTGMIIGIVIGGVVVIVAIIIVIVCLKKRKKQEIEDLKHQLQTHSNTYDGLNMRLRTPEPYAALTVERSDDSHQSSAYLNPYEGLHRTLESSEPYESLEIRI